MKKNIWDLIIIGAGVSGTFAALNIKSNIKVLIIDRNNDILSKFMITGKGKSNITNNLDVKNFLKNIIDSNKFMYPSLTRHNSDGILSLLDQLNINYHEKTKNRFHLIDENKHFREIIKEKLKKKTNIKMLFNTSVIEVDKIDDVFYIKTIDNEFKAKMLILATGGMSYKKLGCDYKGYEISNSLGHEIKQLYPIGVGFIVKNNPFKDLQGISLKEVSISIFSNKKLIYSETGSLMFTHYGIGGPVVRRVSGYLSKLMINNQPFNVKIAWCDKSEVESDIKNMTKLSECFNSLNKKVKEMILKDYNIKTNISNLNHKSIEHIKNLLLNYYLDVDSTENLEYAINTGGGVSTKQINPNTFESRIVDNLYIIGELLDVNPRTNGFNITICYSSAMSASDDINNKMN